MTDSRRRGRPPESAEHAPTEAKPGHASPLDVIALNTSGWNQISDRNSSQAWVARRPDLLHLGRYPQVFDRFCGGVPSGGALLDLGCGKGVPLTRELARRGFAVTGIDLSESMIAAARSNVPQAAFTVMSMTDIAFEGAFDGVVSSYSMLCLDPPRFRETAVRIARALRRGGFLFIVLNEPEPVYDATESHVFEVDGATVFSRPYSEREVVEAFSGCEMEVLHVERDIYTSELYGEERCLMMLLRKAPTDEVARSLTGAVGA